MPKPDRPTIIHMSDKTQLIPIVDLPNIQARELASIAKSIEELRVEMTGLETEIATLIKQLNLQISPTPINEHFIDSQIEAAKAKLNPQKHSKSLGQRIARLQLLKLSLSQLEQARLRMVVLTSSRDEQQRRITNQALGLPGAEVGKTLPFLPAVRSRPIPDEKDRELPPLNTRSLVMMEDLVEFDNLKNKADAMARQVEQDLKNAGFWLAGDTMADWEKLDFLTIRGLALKEKYKNFDLTPMADLEVKLQKLRELRLETLSQLMRQSGLQRDQPSSVRRGEL